MDLPETLSPPSSLVRGEPMEPDREEEEVQQKEELGRGQRRGGGMRRRSFQQTKAEMRQDERDNKAWAEMKEKKRASKEGHM